MDTDRGAGGGTLVLSLDFELLWGVHSTRTLQGYRRNLEGVRTVVPALLEMFRSRGIHATWATVGLLFFDSREEMMARLPSLRPEFRDPRQSSYNHLDQVGRDERDDPWHFAPSLVRAIAATPGQELATHTFSHYFCGEAGADPASFRADLRAALGVAAEKGHVLRSIVLPRNQYDARYLRVCAEEGIAFYRGNPRSVLWTPPRGRVGSAAQRVGRWLDAYADVAGGAPSRGPRREPGVPVDVPADRFLRPWSPRLAALEPLRLRRIVAEMRRAAEAGTTYHLWWHPHNFGAHPRQNLDFLSRVLDAFDALRQRGTMRSATMAEAGQTVLAALAPAPPPSAVFAASHARRSETDA